MSTPLPSTRTPGAPPGRPTAAALPPTDVAGPAAAPVARVAASLGVIYVVWSTTFMAIREALDGLPPFLLCSLRYLTAALLMLGVAAIGRAPWPSRKELAGAAVLGLLIVLAPNAPVAWAEQTIPTGVTALLGAVTPLYVLALSAGFGGERPTRRGVAGILLGLVGVVVLVAPTLTHGLAADLGAEASLLVGSLVCACGMVFGRRLVTPKSAALTSGLTMLVGGACFVVAAMLHGEMAGFHPAAVPLHAWAGLAYLILAGSCLAFSCFTWLVQHARPTLVSTCSYVNPVMAMIVGLVALGEPPTINVFAGAALIVVAVLLVVRGGRTA